MGISTLLYNSEFDRPLRLATVKSLGERFKAGSSQSPDMSPLKMMNGSHIRNGITYLLIAHGLNENAGFLVP
jgi:hypothetical protein